VALLEIAETIGRRVAVLRRARGWRFQIEVVTHALKTGFVDEDREFKLPDLTWRVVAGDRHEDLALGIDRDGRRVLRNGDAGLHKIPLRGYEPALRIKFK